MRGKLNLFQSAMLRWRELSPYNAVHVAQLSGPLDAMRLERAIGAQLAALGVTGFRLDRERRHFEFAGGPAAVPLTVIAAGTDPGRTLEREMERQLNLTFPHDGAFEPFRFFAIDEGATFQLGIAYDHFIAGGDSIVALLKGIVGRYDGSESGSVPAPDLYPPTYWRLFLRNFGAWYVGQFFLLPMIARARRAVRPRYPYGDDAHNGFTSIRLDAAEYEAVIRTAKAWGVTLNDLMLAMLLAALSGAIENRDPAQRRNEIAIASVINIRNDFVPGPSETFGQFLSSFLVSHPVPDGVTLRALAEDVKRQTQRVKRHKLYLQTLYAIAFGGMAWRFMTPAQRRHVHAKNYPVWSGMTMLNVDAIWRAAPGSAPVPAYLRAGATGPFSPLLVAPASAGQCMRVGLTYRTAAFRREDIARMGAALVACARGLVPA